MIGRVSHRRRDRQVSATGSLSATSPSRTIEASSVAVNVFVIEPISKTASGSTPRLHTPVSP